MVRHGPRVSPQKVTKWVKVVAFGYRPTSEERKCCVVAEGVDAGVGVMQAPV